MANITTSAASDDVVRISFMLSNTAPLASASDEPIIGITDAAANLTVRLMSVSAPDAPMALSESENENSTVEPVRKIHVAFLIPDMSEDIFILSHSAAPNVSPKHEYVIGITQYEDKNDTHCIASAVTDANFAPLAILPILPHPTHITPSIDVINVAMVSSAVLTAKHAFFTDAATKRQQHSLDTVP